MNTDDGDLAQTLQFRVLHERTDHDRIVRTETICETLESEVLMLRGTTAEHTIILNDIKNAIADSRRGPTWWYAGTFAFLGVAVLSLVALIGRLMRWW